MYIYILGTQDAVCFGLLSLQLMVERLQNDGHLCSRREYIYIYTHIDNTSM